MKRAAKDKFDCSGEDCRTSNCDIRRDLVDLDVNQKVIMRDLNIKAVQIDGLVEVLGVVNNTQNMLFKTELGAFVGVKGMIYVLKLQFFTIHL